MHLPIAYCNIQLFNTVWHRVKYKKMCRLHNEFFIFYIFSSVTATTTTNLTTEVPRKKIQNKKSLFIKDIFMNIIFNDPSVVLFQVLFIPSCSPWKWCVHENCLLLFVTRHTHISHVICPVLKIALKFKWITPIFHPNWWMFEISSWSQLILSFLKTLLNANN